MTRHIRHVSLFCFVLLVALLLNALRVQVLQADSLDENPANRRSTLPAAERRD
ncbi:hypothetical protein [Streptomyces sp. NRRL F-5135]|uniref:hypothetical protein n=1 Tax=Streptomyces sp. NRRL F-5135 TaxID=1463858 RepID=UPI000A47F10C|nr:hypothetical protein [Streptomyces sp. NRRL F-5135]